MDIIAEGKNIKMSPRKVRLVVDSIKKHAVPHALQALFMLNQRASNPIKKVIDSAIANAVHNYKLDKNDLVIKDILVNEGIKYKRFHFAARGRVRPYKRRTSHIRVILEAKQVTEVVKLEVQEKKEEAGEK